MNAKRNWRWKGGRFLLSCSLFCALAPGAAQAQLRGWSFLVKNGSSYAEARVRFNGPGNAPSVSFVHPWLSPASPGNYKHYDTYYTGQEFKGLTLLDKKLKATTGDCEEPGVPLGWEHQSMFFRQSCNDVGLLSGGKMYYAEMSDMCFNTEMTGSDFTGLSNSAWTPTQNVKQRFYPFAARLTGLGTPTVTYYYLEKPFSGNYQLKRKTYNGSFSSPTVLGTIPAGTASSFIVGEDKYPGVEAQYVGEMEMSPNGRYVAFSITYRSFIDFGTSARSRTIIYLYDNTLGTFTQYSEPYTVFTSGTPTGTLPFVVTGLEFNATSDRLYFTFNGAPTTTVPTGAVGYFSSLSGGLLGTNLTFITNSLDYRSSHIELGLDNKLYLHHYDGSGLARIEESTSTITASAISFAPYAVPLNHEYILDEVNPGIVDYRIRTMPKQSDGYNYIGNEASDASCCNTQAVYNAINVTINPGITLWSTTTFPNSTYYIRDKLTVKTGARLVISATRLEMGKDAQIVIEPGGVVEVVAGSVLTSHCPGATWKGVLVQGNTAFAQDPNPGQTVFYKQGVFRITNSTLENAVVGVSGGDPNDDTKLGGLIVGLNSTFRNCQMGVGFSGNYNFTNKSSFRACTFIVDRPLNESLAFLSHAQISGNFGVVFTGCQFINSNPLAQDYTELGYGILSGNGSFFVKPDCSGIGCPTYTPCKFTGLRSGIYALNFFGPATTTFSVNAAEFDGCHRGIESIVVNNIEILNSTFKVGNIRTNYPGYTDGIFISGTSLNYKVTENKFIGQPQLQDGNVIGITASHTGGTENRIYRNYFTNIGQSTLSNGTNRNTSGGSTSTTGLQFLCNQYSNLLNYPTFREYDIAIVRTDANSGVRYYQGNFVSPTSRSAGNRFSRTNFNTASDVFSDVNHPIVHHYWNTGTQQPLYYTPTLVNPVLATTQETCPSIYGGLEGLVEIGGGKEKSAQRADFEAAQSQLAFYQDQLNKLENGAELTRLLNDARALQNPGQLRARLLEASPYLDAEVLNLTVDKIDLLTPAVLFEILSANPDGLRDEAMFTRLGEEGRLPGWMIDELRQLRGTVSAKTLLQAAITHYASEKTMAAYAFMNQNLGNAETPADRVAVAEWMGKLNTAEGDMALAFDRAAQGNWKEAEALLEALPALYGTENNADAKDLNARFRQVWDRTSAALKNGRTITRLDESEKAFLRTYADELAYEPAGYIARGLLSLNGEPRRNDPKFPGETDKPVVTAKPAVSTDMAGVSWSVYPNPASDLVNVRWSIAGLGDGAEIAVFDVTGRNVFRKNITGEEGTLTVNVDTFSAGTYTLRLQAGGKTFGTKQLVVY